MLPTKVAILVLNGLNNQFDSLSSARWHSTNTHLSSLGILGTKPDLPFFLVNDSVMAAVTSQDQRSYIRIESQRNKTAREIFAALYEVMMPLATLVDQWQLPSNWNRLPPHQSDGSLS